MICVADLGRTPLLFFFLPVSSSSESNPLLRLLNVATDDAIYTQSTALVLAERLFTLMQSYQSNAFNQIVVARMATMF